MVLSALFNPISSSELPPKFTVCTSVQMACNESSRVHVVPGDLQQHVKQSALLRLAKSFSVGQMEDNRS